MSHEMPHQQLPILQCCCPNIKFLRRFSAHYWLGQCFMTGFKEYKSQELSWRVLKIVPQDFLGEAAKSSGYKSPPITVLIQFKAASPREINGMSCPLVKEEHKIYPILFHLLV